MLRLAGGVVKAPVGLLSEVVNGEVVVGASVPIEKILMPTEAVAVGGDKWCREVGVVAVLGQRLSVAT